MNSFRKTVLQALLAAALSCLAAFLLMKVFGAGLTGILVGDDTFYMRYYYDIHNNNTRSYQECDDIVMFDIGAYQSRTDIAGVLSSIARCNPAVIGMDVYMPANSEIRDEANGAVLDAVSKIRCPFISPCLYDEGLQSWSFPFYRDITDNPNCIYASTLSFDLLEQYSGTDPRSEMPTFAYTVAYEYARKAGRHIRPFDKLSVNYRNKDFFPVADTTELDASFIEGKLVLIGDFQDYRDIRNIPFKIMASNQIPGVVNLAYTVNAILCSDHLSKDDGYGFRRSHYNRPFVKCSQLMNLLLSYILCFLYSIIELSIPKREEDEKNVIKSVILILLPALLVIVAEFLLVIVCFELFTSLFLRVPDIFLFMASLLFVSTNNNLVGAFLEKSTHRNKNEEIIYHRIHLHGKH